MEVGGAGMSRWAFHPDSILNFPMSPSLLHWWGWLIVAAILYIAQLVQSSYTDKGGTLAWLVRILMIGGMVISFLLAIVRFVKWAWQG
jgi:hypothetical protein